MTRTDYFCDETMAPGLTAVDVQETARRQLIASIAVAALIACGAGLTALAPASSHVAAAAPHRLALIQHPTFVTPPAQRFAAVTRHEIELP